jgi:signal transduction histidine kinase
VDASRIRPGVTVRIPEGGLHQTLYNLVTNAVDASPRGSRVNLAADVVRGQDGEDWVEIAVRDYGSGILPEFQDRIFEPFFTSKTDDGTRTLSQKPILSPREPAPRVISETVSKGGLGMGLSVVKSIVEAAGGRIEFESTPGEGTVFRVFLCRGPEA